MKQKAFLWNLIIYLLVALSISGCSIENKNRDDSITNSVLSGDKSGDAEDMQEKAGGSFVNIYHDFYTENYTEEYSEFDCLGIVRYVEERPVLIIADCVGKSGENEKMYDFHTYYNTERGIQEKAVIPKVKIKGGFYVFSTGDNLYLYSDSPKGIVYEPKDTEVCIYAFQSKKDGIQREGFYKQSTGEIYPKFSRLICVESESMFYQNNYIDLSQTELLKVKIGEKFEKYLSQNVHETIVSEAVGDIEYDLVHSIEFSDDMIRMAIYDTLNKTVDEDIYQSDLDTIEELVIDKSYAYGVIERSGACHLQLKFDLDLTDLGRLRNLRSLTIENDDYDTVYCLSALQSCKKLNKLCMYYNTSSMVENEVQFGSKELIKIIEACPELTYIDTMVPIPYEMMREAWDLQPSIYFYANGAIQQKGKDNYSGGGYSLKDARHFVNGYSKSFIEYLEGNPMYIVLSNPKKEELEMVARTDSIRTILCIGDIDLSYIKDMKNLKNLYITGFYDVRTFRYIDVSVQNFSYISQMQQLRNLSFYHCVIKGDLVLLDNLKNLRGLGYEYCNLKLPENLEILKKLYRFEAADDCINVSAYLKYMVELQKLRLTGINSISVAHLPDLRSLRIMFQDDFNLGQIRDNKGLRYLCIEPMNSVIEITCTELALPELDTVILNGNIVNPVNIANCVNIHSLYIKGYWYDEEEGNSIPKIDLNEYKNMKQLSCLKMCLFSVEPLRDKPELLENVKGIYDLYMKGLFFDAISDAQYYKEEGGYSGRYVQYLR